MNYLESLPKNVHEDIVGRLRVDQIYSVTKATHQDLVENNKKIGDMTLLQFYKPLILPKHILSTLTEKQKLSLQYKDKVKVICLRKIIMKGNIFIGQCYKSSHIIPKNRSDKCETLPFIFDGNNSKVYFEDECICLSDKSNEYLKGYLKEISQCDNCSKTKDEYVFVSTYCHNCFKTFKKHKTCLIKSCNYNYNEDGYYEGGRTKSLDVCNDCLRQCNICQKIVCKKNWHCVFCKDCEINICWDHILETDDWQADNAVICPKCNEEIIM